MRNIAPRITTDRRTVHTVQENEDIALDIDATDWNGDTIFFSFTNDGGPDRRLFTIDQQTGVLSFRNAPDFENPMDADGDNVYEVSIRASDGLKFDEEDFTIRVTDDPNEGVVLTPSPLPSDNGPAASNIEGTAASGEVLEGTNANDIYNGNGGGDFFIASAGNDVFNGDSNPNTYDQIDYQGARSEYTFTRNADGSVTVTTPEGTDTLNNIDGIWFHGSQEWVSVDDLATSAPTVNPGTPTDPSGTNSVEGTAAGGEFLDGTDSFDFYFGNGGGDFFSGSAGNDEFYGDANAYDQIDYQGARSEYAFTLNNDGSITAITPEGTDTLNDIDGIWFHGSQEWVSTDDLI